jgi:dihydroxy-acid dehydratase
MEDFYYAGGLRAILKRLVPHLHANAITVTGHPLVESARDGEIYDEDVIRPLDNPIYAEGATAVLRGNLAPNGCVMKPAAAERRLLKHTGPAIVFEDYGEMKSMVERDDLDVTPDHVMVLKNAGPLGGPGMPEWGMLPIPKKLVKAGVRDMLRISDARMSGTSYGACVLHVSPEAYIGGPLALVRTGDLISVDVARRSIELKVGEEELQRRKTAWTQPKPRYERGFGWLSARHMTQADRGCDFDFLETGFGAPVAEPAIY